MGLLIFDLKLTLASSAMLQLFQHLKLTWYKITWDLLIIVIIKQFIQSTIIIKYLLRLRY